MNEPEDHDKTPRFDLSALVASLREGRAELLKRKVRLEREQALIAAQIEGVNSDLERIDLMLPSSPPDPASELPAPAPKRPRQAGVQDEVERMIGALVSETRFDLDAAMAWLATRAGSYERSSVRSALSRLAERGKLLRVSAERARNPSYQVPPFVAPADAQPVLVAAAASAAPSMPPTADGVREQVVALLKTAGDTGMARSDLAWRLNDASLLDDALADPRIVEIAAVPGTYRLKLEQAELFPA